MNPPPPGTCASILLCPLLAWCLAVQTASAQELRLVTATLTSNAEAPLAGVYVHDDLAFVGGMSTGYYSAQNIGIRIVDLSVPNQPELVGRIPLRSSGFFDDHSHGDAVATHLATNAFEGRVAIVLDGVPDSFAPAQYPEPYGIWDVSDPARPSFLSILNFGHAPHGIEGGDLGDKPRTARAVHGHHFYALYEAGPRPIRDFRLGVADISDPSNPVIVGSWQDDQRAALMGLALNDAGTRAYVTGVWSVTGRWGRDATHRYVYVLDIEDPSAPKEIGRYVVEQSNVVSSMFVARPAKDDAIVVLADGTWEAGQEGIVHILDASNPSAIVKIAEFDTAEDFGMATGVAIRGDRVYSTWLNGAVVAIDIADPTRPEAVSQFTAAPNFSDVALLGDGYIVVSSVWSAGLYVLQDQISSTRPDETVFLPQAYLLDGNSPNPFNLSTEIGFGLPRASNVRLAVYDLIGREVSILASGHLPAGRHRATWQTDGLPSGVYLYRLTADSFSGVRSMVLFR